MGLFSEEEIIAGLDSIPNATGFKINQINYLNAKEYRNRIRCGEVSLEDQKALAKIRAEKNNKPIFLNNGLKAPSH